MMTDTLVLDSIDGGLVADHVGPDGAPLVVCLPGMGDLRTAYRHLAPLLLARGLRVATLDLPGHGDSEAGAEPSQVRIGQHAAALVGRLGGPAVVVGHSYTPDSAVVAAGQSSAVLGAVCVAPWWRTPPQSSLVRGLSAGVASSPRAWGWFYRSLHKAPPTDLDEHISRIRRSLHRPGGTTTLRRMALGHGKDGRDHLTRASVPVVVVMGAKDPDFRDPSAEAQAYADACRGEVVMAPGAGHYPHAEAPEVVASAVDRVLALTGGSRA